MDQSLANAIYIQDYCEMMDTNKKAYFSIKQRFYNGAIGLIAAGPVTAAFAPPFPMNGDVHGDLMKLIGRILDANNYKEDPMGVALGIAGRDARAARSRNAPAVSLCRGGTEQLSLLGPCQRARRLRQLGTRTPGTDGPVQINIRVRLWKGGSFVGLYSTIVTITVNP